MPAPPVEPALRVGGRVVVTRSSRSQIDDGTEFCPGPRDLLEVEVARGALGVLVAMFGETPVMGVVSPVPAGRTGPWASVGFGEGAEARAVLLPTDSLAAADGTAPLTPWREAVTVLGRALDPRSGEPIVYRGPSDR